MLKQCKRLESAGNLSSSSGAWRNLQAKYGLYRIIYMNLNNNNMLEKSNRNTLLNYLNDNKIDYKFDPTDQTIECHYDLFWESI
jgi:hypothetical protein